MRIHYFIALHFIRYYRGEYFLYQITRKLGLVNMKNIVLEQSCNSLKTTEQRKQRIGKYSSRQQSKSLEFSIL